MVLIGSRALALRAPHLLQRSPLDFDFICSRDEYEVWMKEHSDKVKPTEVYPILDGAKMIVKGDSILEFEFIEPGSSNQLLAQLVKDDPETLDAGAFGKVPCLDLLFAIKSSHRFKKFKDNPMVFWKTALDRRMMLDAGAKIRDEHQAFFKLREKESYAAQKHPKLNQSKEAFFSDNGLESVMVYDHDDLHKAVALYDRPAYTYYLKDNEPVLTDKAKFFNCSRDIQLAGVCEEALTLALERSLVPKPGVWSPDYAFRFALAKVCTSITSGFFREFAHTNVFETMRLYEEKGKDYHSKFKRAAAEGRVRPFSGSQYPTKEDQ